MKPSIHQEPSTDQEGAVAGCGRYPDALLGKDLGFQGDLANVWRYRADGRNTVALRGSEWGHGQRQSLLLGTDEMFRMASGIDFEIKLYSELQVSLSPQEVTAMCQVGAGIWENEGDGGGESRAKHLQMKAGLG